MRFLPLLLALPLAACGGGDDRGNTTAQNAATPAPRRPPPKTPVLEVPAGGNGTDAWIEPRVAPGPVPSAPYGNLLDAPVVETRGPR